MDNGRKKLNEKHGFKGFNLSGHIMSYSRLWIILI
ncbi:hypothetical protein Bccel_2603 [Pseudobacteroides cellulosolvens ATCC 35603 = DSM 2933]|uniref:Uncharacterized protein n=1 Tax=Pseudobacteroides cellulosolvens ATCC 35603 = DSM 2933 TaxID=398512 RepID=A0A0L6JPM9_9FIRM|nr:hypothetical protein Bccel_2603 [Pseudobacteroides cellulosolvens ATCC 35603 = DSM 2933]